MWTSGAEQIEISTRPQPLLNTVYRDESAVCTKYIITLKNWICMQFYWGSSTYYFFSGEQTLSFYSKSEELLLLLPPPLPLACVALGAGWLSFSCWESDLSWREHNKKLASRQRHVSTLAFHPSYLFASIIQSVVWWKMPKRCVILRLSKIFVYSILQNM